MSKIILDCIGFALLRSVIGLEIKLKLNFEIKTGGPRACLGAATPFIYLVIPYNIIPAYIYEC